MKDQTVLVSKALLDKFAWDERRQTYSYLVPMIRPAWAGTSALQHARYRVEFRPEGYAVLVPNRV